MIVFMSESMVIMVDWAEKFKNNNYEKKLVCGSKLNEIVQKAKFLLD